MIGPQIVGESATCVFDHSFVEDIDANDNGIKRSSLLSELVSAFMPNWDDADQNVDNRFVECVEKFQPIFNRKMETIISANAAVEMVEHFYAKSKSTNGILLLEKFVPWQEAVKHHPDVKMVVFPSLRGGYNAQVVSGWLISHEFCQWLNSHPESGISFVHHARFMMSGTYLDDIFFAARKAVATLETIE